MSFHVLCPKFDIFVCHPPRSAARVGAAKCHKYLLIRHFLFCAIKFISSSLIHPDLHPPFLWIILIWIISCLFWFIYSMHHYSWLFHKCNTSKAPCPIRWHLKHVVLLCPLVHLLPCDYAHSPQVKMCPHGWSMTLCKLRLIYGHDGWQLCILTNHLISMIGVW